MADPYTDVGRANTPEALEAMMERSWWVIGVRGIIAIIFGLCAFFFTGPTILSLVLLFAAFSLVDGVFAFIGAARAIRHHQHWAFLALQGVISIFAGVVALTWPGLTVVAFVLVLAAWAVVSGASMIGLAIGVPSSRRWWMILSGALSLLFGLALVIAPIVGAVVLTWWLGAFTLVFGISLIVLAFNLHSPHHGTTAGTGTAAPA